MNENPLKAQELRSVDDSDRDASRRTVLAAERTWLAWFRTGIGVAAAAIGVGGIVPKLSDSTSWGYIVLGAGFAALAVGVFYVGWRRQQEMYRAIQSGQELPTGVNAFVALTAAGGVLAIATVLLLFTEL